ncbi:SDR family oxidoreductase [Sphingopyxis flava]|uniref:NAD(P)-dependent dehydrogenase, short-chain alcohol dehydrogenase family n=1 Tax=Sphingopyxis flava TaxID=1507287 RepID=A0A1T5FGM5_9SPHN|nr:SDR family NAD(P)-dependent oxidoreductase [Sphingopyxis flava]SKB95238.1 NAD(P)-dependent dehydrogenase, short-chain alcohol dehydrogenase family [Sphingopyxis flava]
MDPTDARPAGPVLVTGAARGLGAAITVALADGGVEPLLLGRSLASLADTRAKVAERRGRTVRCIAADVADWEGLRDGIDAALQPGETLAGIVNNAGVIDPIDRVEDSDPAAWAHCITVNLVGGFHVLRAALPRLARGGVIANLSSGAAAAEHAGWSAYAASKAGLERLSATLAAERPDLVVLAVRPGVTATGMQDAIKASHVDNAIRQMPRDAMQPVEVPAKAIARLFSGPLPGFIERVVEAQALREID